MATPGYVKFKFVPAGHVLPPAEERDINSLYFVEDTQQLFKGPLLVADHIDIDEVLQPYRVKSVEIQGTDGYVSSVSFDDESGKLSFTKSDLDEAVHRITAADPNLAHASDITVWYVVT